MSTPIPTSDRTAAGGDAGAPLLEVVDLKTYFDTPDGVARAVDGVSFTLQAGETLGLVGESGCGKTVTALSILRLVPEPPGRIVGGAIRFEGRDLLALTEREMQTIRGNRISMVFQEPMTSLNPVFTVGSQIMEAILLHQRVGRREALARTVELLRRVGIAEPERRVHDYPHQLSGGMRQRVMIAMALACTPRLLIADEPTTALDVTIQAQILELIVRLKAELGMAVLLITHDLGVVAETAQRVCVMYAGRIVEAGPVEAIFAEPRHPYTQGLLGALPRLERAGERPRLKEIPGVVPPLTRLPGGCRFCPRYELSRQVCRPEPPPVVEVGPGHWVRCWAVAAAAEPARRAAP
ncbi:MAG TPA: ABC transporter ATP-binding protein [Thermodesulfobacteriota bacterium]|nr:ABC transporter ATP-binding protein [Thermodesulfobacteriota bacterium]